MDLNSDVVCEMDGRCDKVFKCELLLYQVSIRNCCTGPSIFYALENKKNMKTKYFFRYCYNNLGRRIMYNQYKTRKQAQCTTLFLHGENIQREYKSAIV